MTEALGLTGTTADTVLAWYDAIVRSVSDITAGHTASPAGTAAYAQLRAAVEATVAHRDTASSSSPPRDGWPCPRWRPMSPS